MKRVMLIILALVAIAYTGLCAALYAFQRNLLYSPPPPSARNTTGTMVVPTATDRVLASIKPREGRDAVIYFGGNGEDVSYSLPTLAKAFPDHALYLLHYRGFGGSSGTPSEAAMFGDALTLFDHVHAAHDRIVVIGSSLGTGVATYLSSLRPVVRLVLVTPYDSLQEIYAAKLTLLPVRWLILDKFESWKYAAGVTAPTLVLAAENDEMIPRASTEQLFSRFKNGPASLKIVPGVTHNSIYQSPQYVPLLRESKANLRGVCREDLTAQAERTCGN